VDDEDVTVVVASHDPLVEEYADLTVPLRDGRIEA
jgi:ABC-type lipoprotein export system ATPase subunit